MLLATICIIDAATARWPVAFVATSTWAYYALADVFVVAALAYDAVTRRYIHPAYIWGGLLIVVAQVLRDVVGRTGAWQAFAALLLK
jgi:hypothetical protein